MVSEKRAEDVQKLGVNSGICKERHGPARGKGVREIKTIGANTITVIRSEKKRTFEASRRNGGSRPDKHTEQLQTGGDYGGEDSRPRLKMDKTLV